MKESNVSLPEGGLVYEAELPLEWQTVDHEPAASRIVRMDENNEELLRFIAVLEEHNAGAQNEELVGNVQAFERVEYKINLLLDMVAHILKRHMELPEPVMIRLSASTIYWQALHPPAVGAHLLLKLYLNPKYPQPLRLTGVVNEAPYSPGGFNSFVSIENMGEAVQSWLEKLIFRQHRRAVAHARQHKT